MRKFLHVRPRVIADHHHDSLRRLSDRAIVQQFFDVLDEEGKHTNDSLTLGSAKTLQCLLDIERETARGELRTIDDTISCLEAHWSEMKSSIPYLGIMKVGRKGVTKDWVRTEPQHPQSAAPESVHAANHIFSAAGFGEAFEHGHYAHHLPVVPEVPPAQMMPLVGLSGAAQLGEPNHMANVNDWVFQGVDGAFFDCIMRGSADWEQDLQMNNG